MRRWLRVVAVALIALVGACVTAPVPHTAVVESEFAASAVKVHVNGRWCGSGTIIHQNRRSGHVVVVTAAHVVLPEANEDGTFEISQSRDGGAEVRVAALVVRLDKAGDLALLSAFGRFRGAAPIATREDVEELKVGDSVALYGFSRSSPEGRHYVGPITNLGVLDYEPLWPNGNLLYEIPVEPGTSGSGVWASCDGLWKVVSVNQGMYVNELGVVTYGMGAEPTDLLAFLLVAGGSP